MIKFDLEKIAQEYDLKIDLTDYKILGFGDNGTSFKLKNGNVIKITGNFGEANVAKKLLNIRNKYLVDVYYFKKLDDEKFLYEIEYVKSRWTKQEIEYFNNFSTLYDPSNDLKNWNDFLKMETPDKIKKLNEIHKTNDRPTDILNDNEKIIFWIEGLEKIRKELDQLGLGAEILSTNLKNFGIKNGNLARFDFNGEKN